MQAVKSLAGQKKKNALQWQKSGESETIEADTETVTPSFLGSYEDVKGVQ